MYNCIVSVEGAFFLSANSLTIAQSLVASQMSKPTQTARKRKIRMLDDRTQLPNLDCRQYVEKVLRDRVLLTLRDLDWHASYGLAVPLREFVPASLAAGRVARSRDGLACRDPAVRSAFLFLDDTLS